MKAESGIWKLLLAAWLFIMMALPNTASRIKIGLLLILVLYALWRAGLQFNRRFLVAVILWELCFGLFYLNAAANHYAFSFTLFEIYFLRPLFLLVICRYSGTGEMMQAVRRILLLITLFIEVYNLLFILQTFGMIPVVIVEDSSASLSIVSSEFLTMRVANQTALMFLIPYIIFLFFRRRVFGKKEKNCITVLFFLGMFVSILSGRRILQLLSMVFFVLNWMSVWKRKITARAFLKGAAAVIAVAAAVLVFAVLFRQEFRFSLFSLIHKTIGEAFDQSSGGWMLRYRQFELLMKDWIKKPIWGWGLSAYNSDYYVYKFGQSGVADTQDLWSYEFFYIALLFQTGLVGIVLVCGVVYRVIKRILIFLRNCADKQLSVSIRAILCGSAAFFIAGFTNPMITSIWFWFLLLCVYDYVLETDGNG